MKDVRIVARIRAGVVLGIVFVLGVLAGVAFERHHGRTRTTVVPDAAAEHQAAMDELRDVVGLDDAQIEQVHSILARHHDIVQHSWEQLRPEVQQAMRQVHVEIAELLRPEQRRRFHDWLMQRREPFRDLHRVKSLER